MQEAVQRNALERSIVVVCSLVLWLTSAVIFVILTANTVLRYVSGSSLQWANELPELLFPWLVMAGVVLGAQHGAHITTTFLMEKLSPAVRRPLTVATWIVVAALYAVLSAVAVLRLRSQGELFRLRPRTGDLTFAAMVTLVLYGLAFAFHSLVTSRGEAHHGWIVRVYLVAGNPFSEQRHLVAGGIALLAALEELTWRGYVTPLLEERLGPLKGGALATALFALAHLPTVWLLADPVAGLNPLLPFAAFGCGAAWTYLRWRMDRLVPSLISHALFTWAMVEFPLWGMGSG